MLKISNLTFSYHNKDIFSNINLSLNNQTRIAVIGKNGTGKSTLLKLLAKQLRPSDGSIKIDDQIGFLPQAHSYQANKSGGEQTKHLLEQLLYQKPDVLLLDEPTNNLDQESLAWLLTELSKFRGLILFANHDRAFIDQVATHLIDINQQQLHLHTGNYSQYLIQQNQLKQRQLLEYQKALKAKSNLQTQISQAKNYTKSIHHPFNKIKDESRSAFKTKRHYTELAAGRKIKTAHAQLSRLNNISTPHEDKIYQPHIELNSLQRRRLLQVKNLTKQYTDTPLFKNLSFEIFPKERCQISGRNGSGKTTLFRIIMGEILPTSGNIQIFAGLKISYISQEIHNLTLDKNFLNQVDSQTSHVFRVAASLGLAQSDLTKPCVQLSRGQLTKLAFLKIILTPTPYFLPLTTRP